VSDEKNQKISVQSAAQRQIHAAIDHLHKSDYLSAVTLAGAAEGVLPHTDKPHLLPKLKALTDADPNAIRNWAKHGGHAGAEISERDAILETARAVSKYAAVYGGQTAKMKEFVEWAIPRVEADDT
jgi:hypothetical protein